MPELTGMYINKFINTYVQCLVKYHINFKLLVYIYLFYMNDRKILN